MTTSVVPIVIVASLLYGGMQPSDSSNDSIRESATHTLSKDDPEMESLDVQQNTILGSHA